VRVDARLASGNTQFFYKPHLSMRGLSALQYAGGARLEITERRVLFDASPYLTAAYYTAYDVANDGRFLFVKPPPDPGVQVVVGWSAELAARLAARR
jgi:hypothetical protein